MTIQDLINGEKVSLLHVNVLKQISKDQFIVADNTGLAVLHILSGNSNNVEVGKGLKMMKPSLGKDKLITSHPKLNPMKTRSLQITVNQAEVDKLMKMNKQRNPVDKGISFKQIERDHGNKALIDTILVYVTTTSRVIEGKFGDYQICNIVDHEGTTFSINLYKQHVGKLEANQVYVLQKVKKTTINTDTGIRMATTNVTKIHEATPDQIDVFSDIKLADKMIHGVCMMFSDFNYYRSCKKHLTKLDEDGKCLNCGELIKDDSKPDFRCTLIIEDSNKTGADVDEKEDTDEKNVDQDDDQDDDSVISIVVFMRHLGIQVGNNDNEEQILDTLEENIVGKLCEIHYNVVGVDNNVAVKVSIK